MAEELRQSWPFMAGVGTNSSPPAHTPSRSFRYQSAPLLPSSPLVPSQPSARDTQGQRSFSQKGLDVTGYAKADLSLKGKQSYATTGQYSKLDNRGTILLKNIKATSELFPKAFFIKQGNFRFQNEKMWFEKFYASYGDNTIISNGVKTWTVIKEERSVYESDATDDEDGINPKKLMTIWETGFKNKFDREDKLNGEAVYVIDLFPKVPAKAEYHTIVLYISKTDNELKKAILKAKDGTVMTYSMTKFTSNPEIDDKKFVFDKTKFPGYPVIRD